MSRILLADDSTHAQRMGERILLEEGFEVVTVTDGQTALLRLADVDPDVILADAFLPRRSGMEICEFVKSQPRYRYVRVVLTAGMLEDLKDEDAAKVQADATLRKPFEASRMVKMLRKLAADADVDRSKMPADLMATVPLPEPPRPIAVVPHAVPAPAPAPAALPVSLVVVDSPKPALTLVPPPEPTPAPVSLPATEPEPELQRVSPPESPAPVVVELPVPAPGPALADVEAERVRAAVTVALDAAMPQMIDDLTTRILAALRR